MWPRSDSITQFSRALPILFVLVLLAAGCRRDKPDPHSTMDTALGLSAGDEVRDSVNVPKYDRVDWRVFSHSEEAEIKVVYRVGDFTGDHDVTGVIEVFDSEGNVLDTARVAPGSRNFPLQFVARPHANYFLRLTATEGAATYIIYAQAERIDPCERCGPDEQCIDDRCELKRPACDPECDVAEECRDGRCVAIECARGEHFSRRAAECVPDPCYRHRCRRGERCVRRAGRAVCVRPRPARPAGCDPPCGADQICRRGQCVAKPTECPPCPSGQKCDPETNTCRPIGRIEARILNHWPADGATVMLLNRGSVHGITRGMKGRISGGGSVQVIEVYPAQSRARTTLSADQLRDRGTITFEP